MDIAKELPTVIAFCAGYGGIERGLDLTGFEHRVIAYVEIEAFAIANLVNKMETGKLPPAPIYTDIKAFPAEVFRGKVSILTGGYPCQPFSTAGKRLGEDDPRHLWPHIRRHIQAIRPARCFFENVEGHISLGLSSVIGDLEEDGYRSTWGIFSAREVSAPHQRKRVYIMGDSEYNGLFAAEVGRSIDQASDHNAQRQSAPRKSTGAGQPNCGANLSATNEMADSKSQFSEWGKPERARARQPKKAAGDRSFIVADSNIERSQRGLQGRCFNKERREKPALRCATECCDWGSWYRRGAWPPEPGLGRVVDGCANRVDRIRLLGNAVVPQTAAKAWQVLDARFNNE